MKFSLLLRAITVLLVLTGMSLSAKSEPSIVGTWKLVSMVSRDDATGTETLVWGDNPIGFLTYTAGGRMSAVLASSQRKISAPSAGQASVEEQAMLLRDSFAYAGRYTRTADGVIHHVEVAMDPTWIGKDQRRFARVEGSKLFLSAPSVRTAASTRPLSLVLTWERIE